MTTFDTAPAHVTISMLRNNCWDVVIKYVDKFLFFDVHRATFSQLNIYNDIHTNINQVMRQLIPRFQ